MKIVKDLSKSVYGFKYPVKGSFNLGEICPIGAPIEVLPYDVINAECAMVIRMATPIAPIMDDLDAEITAHFVPLRLISTKYGDSTNAGSVNASGGVGSQHTFEEIIGNGLGNPADWMATDNEQYHTPKATWNPGTAAGEDYTTIGEALGLGLGCGSATPPTQEILAYPLYGYNLIYQERFRNQDVETAKPTLDLGSNLYGASGSNIATTGSDGTYNHSLSVAYKHGDFFTNGKPSPTKGAEVPLQLGVSAPLAVQSTSYELDNINPNSSYNKVNLSDGLAGGQLFVNDSGELHSSTNSYPAATYFGNVDTTNLVTDLRNATASTINEFITSFNVQRLLMNDIKGTRYYEVIKNHFAVENDDIRLYIPELLNIRRFSINISPVVQQSGAASATSGTAQDNYLGTTGGYSFTTNKGSLVHHAFGEFGYIYFLIVIRQRHTYGQGIPKLYLRDSRFDFFFPELGRVGYQRIDKVELNADETPGSTFAWQPAWQELRDVNQAQAFGFLNPMKASSLDYWTLTDALTATPTLGMAFLKENRTNLARALTISDQGPDFIMDAMIYGKKSTLVPIGTQPKLFN